MSTGSDVVTIVRGMTWNHTRGYVSIVAASQRFEELNPGVRIVWEKRSLREFGEAPPSAFADAYDLLVMDHPFAGEAARSGVLVPFEETDAVDAIGASQESYRHAGRLWALPIDAACPVAAWRADDPPDIPATWDNLLDLAREGRLLVPLIHTDAVIHWLMLTRRALGARAEYTERDLCAASSAALDALAELASHLDERCLRMNPIAVHEALASGSREIYGAWLFGYNPYGRARYAERRLAFGPAPQWSDASPLPTALGGTGLAVSARRGARQTAMEFARFAASPRVQCGVFFDAGGQPAHEAAWNDPRCDDACGGFLFGTRAATERAFLRSRAAGFPAVQELIGHAINAFLRGDSQRRETDREISRLVRRLDEPLWR